MELDASSVVAFVAAIAALVTAIATYIKGHSERAKLDADREETMTRAAISLIAPLKLRLDQQAARIAELESQVAALQRENAELHEGVRVLCGQLSALGQEPRWRPGQGARL